MKKRLFALGSLVLLLGAQAQPVDRSLPSTAAAERARIEAERSSAQVRFENEEASCYQRFAVNDCLREVRVRRRAVLEELRRQEIILNDADRKKRAAEQARRADEKSSAQILKDEAEKRAAERQANEQRLERAGQKKASHAGNEPVQGVGEPQVRASAAGSPSHAGRAEDKKAFDEKLQKAQERKAQRDKALAEKKGKPARPLPDPP